ncbi:hypothetical protein ACTJJ0_00675 [Chitinophaga sp. 22321]|uniref:Immunity protein 49 n=1 Tax=Chitinophaga hostae TaxID=2831022 RepID=A0ABS5IVF1_9BACT|nr:hypothetical protein [Chitinophaga hostae]MBS0026933.1 hypothetical protein [Chitinophaga hostae]
MSTDKKISSFVSKKQMELETAYKSLSSYSDYISFLEASIRDYAESGREEFSSTFVEFGQTFTTEYHIVDLLTGMAVYRTAQVVVTGNSGPLYSSLLNAQYFKILALLKCLQEKKTAKSIFSTEISTVTILAAVYFPEVLPPLAEYFAFYLEEETVLMNRTIYANLLGKIDLMPLAVFVAKESAGYDLLPKIKNYISDHIQPVYQQAMEQLYSEDTATVSAWIDGLVTYHITNSKDDWTLPFNHTIWQYYPLEIIALLELRKRKGMDNSFIDNPLLNTWKPLIESGTQIKADDLVLKLYERITGRP